VKAIIFDFDDTLERYKPAKHHAEDEVGEYFYKKYNIKHVAEMFDNIDMSYTIKGMREKNIRLYKRELWFKTLFERLGMKPKRNEIKKLCDIYWKAIQNHAAMMPDAKQVLSKLKKNFKLVIMSDSDGNKKTKMKRLRKLGVVNYFDLIVTGDDVKTTKPDKRFYDYIFRKLKIKSCDCVMVGDKPEFDLKLAKKLGMKTVWFVYGDWAEHKKNKKLKYVDHKVKHLKQLHKIVTQ